MKVELVEYEVEGQPFEGRLVYSGEGSEPLPGLLLCPNWMGVTDDAVDRASAFAERGHVVFVVDIYGKPLRPADHHEAGTLANALRADPARVRTRMLRALEVFEAEGGSRRLLAGGLRSVIGFCFGAGNALELARAGAPLQAAVAIHGDLNTSLRAQAGVMQAAVLSIQGALDPIIPLEHRTASKRRCRRRVFSGRPFCSGAHGTPLRMRAQTFPESRWATGTYPTRPTGSWIAFSAMSRPAIKR